MEADCDVGENSGLNRGNYSFDVSAKMRRRSAALDIRSTGRRSVSQLGSESALIVT